MSVTRHINRSGDGYRETVDSVETCAAFPARLDVIREAQRLKAEYQAADPAGFYSLSAREVLA